MDILKLVNRSSKILDIDIDENENELSAIVSQNRFLVIGGAGTIGQAVVKQIFKRDPMVLHVVDISENNLVELVRDIRSSLGYIKGEFSTFAIDVGSHVFDLFWESNGDYDYVLNLSALKHVRSEKDPFTILRMIEVNILNSMKIAEFMHKKRNKNYFCVSTDKAANPVNMIGASKRLMEKFIIGADFDLKLSMARFANVAFSDGSLPSGFLQRMLKRQPISAPDDVLRYFVTPEEAGELCLLAALLGKNNEIFFPINDREIQLTSFKMIATNYLRALGIEPVECGSEDEARDLCHKLNLNRQWPCYFFNSDTTGEKPFEEFFTETDKIDVERFSELGIISTADQGLDKRAFEDFRNFYNENIQRNYDKSIIVSKFRELLPEFTHDELSKYLEQRM